jgi:hypothetical protein
MRLDSMRPSRTLLQNISAWMASLQPLGCNMCRRPLTTRRRRLERYHGPVVTGSGHRLTCTDDGHQLRRRVQICCQLLPPNGKVQLCRLDRSRRIDECLHREQGPSHERLQLLQSRRRSARPQSCNGVEQQGDPRQCPLPWQHHDSGTSCGFPSSLNRLIRFHRWSRRISRTSRI